MTAVRGTLAVLALLTLAACGSSGTKSRRDAVNTYFGQVKTAQIKLVGGAGQIDAALGSFSLTRSTPAELARLRQARSTVDQTLRRMRALDPPPDARRLHDLLVRRLALQRDVIEELIQTATTIPKLAAATAPLQNAAATLRSDLSTIKTPAPATATTPTSAGGQVFATAGCAGCHTLGAAGSTGTAGPNLDALKPSAAAVAAQVRSGGGGMPSFKGSLSEAQIAAVADYVATSAGKATVSSTGSAAVLDQYAAAFGRYGVALKPVDDLLRAVSAPSILQPALDVERRALERSIALCATIRKAILRRDIPAANAAIHSLLTISSTVNGLETRKAQAAAAKAYDDRLHAIDALATKINEERSRLVLLIG